MSEEFTWESEAFELKDDSEMWFGKHKGKKLKDVPADYLLYLLDNGIEDNKPRLFRYIQRNIDVIEDEAERMDMIAPSQFDIY
jgi:uncharacterized protein (DUF3820 family)